MLRLLLRKIATLLPTLLGVTLVAFALIRLIPGDPVEIGGTGAYVYSTGNHFAGFTQPAVFLVERTGRLRCMRRAEHLADLTALERRG